MPPRGDSERPFHIPFDCSGLAEASLGEIATRSRHAATTVRRVAAREAEVRGQRRILIDTDEHRVVFETITASTADPDVYRRGGILVRVVLQFEAEEPLSNAEI